MAAGQPAPGPAHPAPRVPLIIDPNQHREIAVRCGLRPVEIDAIANSRIAPTWSPVEATLIHLADTLVDGTSVDGELWAEAARSWDHAQLLEIVMMVGFYRMLAGLMNSVRLPPDGPPAQQRDEEIETRITT